MHSMANSCFPLLLNVVWRLHMKTLTCWLLIRNRNKFLSVISRIGLLNLKLWSEGNHHNRDWNLELQWKDNIWRLVSAEIQALELNDHISLFATYAIISVILLLIYICRFNWNHPFWFVISKVKTKKKCVQSH